MGLCKCRVEAQKGKVTCKLVGSRLICWSDVNDITKGDTGYCPPCEDAGCPPFTYELGKVLQTGFQSHLDPSGHPKSQVLADDQPLSTYTGALTMLGDALKGPAAPPSSHGTQVPLHPELQFTTQDAIDFVVDISNGKKSIEIRGGEWRLKEDMKQKDGKDQAKQTQRENTFSTSLTKSRTMAQRGTWKPLWLWLLSPRMRQTYQHGKSLYSQRNANRCAESKRDASNLEQFPQVTSSPRPGSFPSAGFFPSSETRLKYLRDYLDVMGNVAMGKQPWLYREQRVGADSQKAEEKRTLSTEDCCSSSGGAAPLAIQDRKGQKEGGERDAFRDDSGGILGPLYTSSRLDPSIIEALGNLAMGLGNHLRAGRGSGTGVENKENNDPADQAKNGEGSKSDDDEERQKKIKKGKEKEKGKEVEDKENVDPVEEAKRRIQVINGVAYCSSFGSIFSKPQTLAPPVSQTVASAPHTSIRGQEILKERTKRKTATGASRSSGSGAKPKRKKAKGAEEHKRR
ncbi:hypothetical protein QBC44DRAFT_306338 [Cladorrhinum sp. PSN332]|nr:hypothetical protein QBC44DRAFT_306338 [Cladorrhinum sp. PSN332]